MNIKSEELSGLSTPEAARLLARDGFNELPDTAKQGLLELLRKMVSEPMFLLLIACGAIYLVLGNRQEAMMLLGFVFVVMGITFVQQRRAENSLSALRELSGPQALVIRDGKTIKISGRELVCGDIVLLSEGDRIYAEVPYQLAACSEFVRDTVIPMLGKELGAQVSQDELYLRISNWLRIVRSKDDILEICYDYQTDWDLFRAALDGRIPSWCMPRLVADRINELLRFEYYEKNALPEHHALNDARANRYAFREHPPKTA